MQGPSVSLTSLVGREKEMREVTLTGVGGSGKTRLAAELALRVDCSRTCER